VLRELCARRASVQSQNVRKVKKIVMANVSPRPNAVALLTVHKGKSVRRESVSVLPHRKIAKVPVFPRATAAYR